MTARKMLIAFGLLAIASIAFAAERLPVYVERGTDYYLLYDGTGNYIAGVGSANPTVRTAFATSGHVIPDGALFFRTDLGTFYTPSAGVFGAATIAGQTFTSATLTAPTITAPVITGITSDPTTAVDVGTEAVTNMTATETGDGAVHRTLFTFSAHSVTMTDAGAAGNHGSVPIYTFPAGFINIHGAFCNVATLAGAGGIADTAQVVLSVGSVVVATDNATLTGTEADIIASFAGTLSSGAGVFTEDGAAIAANFDGHTTSEAIFLNIAVPDAGSTASDTLALTGTCSIVWSNLGDF